MNLRVSINPFCGLCLPIPKFGKSVQQNNGCSALRASLHNMQTDAVRFNIAIFHTKCICLQTKRGGILTDKYEAGMSPKFCL